MASYSTSSFFWFRFLRIRRPNSTACSASTVPCDSLSSCSARFRAIVHSMRVTDSSLSSGVLADLRGTGRLFLGMAINRLRNTGQANGNGRQGYARRRDGSYRRTRPPDTSTVGIEHLVQLVEQVGGFFLRQAEMLTGKFAALVPLQRGTVAMVALNALF